MHKATSPKTIVSSLDDGLEPSPTTMEQSSTKSPSLIMPIDLADARSNVQTGQHRRATAVDFMETRLSPPSFASRERTSYPNAPSHPGDGDHHHTPAQNVGVADSTTSTIVSPTVLPSENESFEIVMEQASPVKSFNAKATNASAEVQRSRAVLEALDKPLEEPFTKCRWGTGCLDLDCKFAHPSPALQSRWGSSGDLPRTRTECSDGVRCPNTGESHSILASQDPLILTAMSFLGHTSLYVVSSISCSAT